jgi:hypothetical protein
MKVEKIIEGKHTELNERINTNVINHSKAQLNPICHLLALLGAHHIFHVRR